MSGFAVTASVWRWSAYVGEGGHPELDGAGLAPERGVDLGELVLGAGEADLEALDLAGPAFALGFGDAGGEVVADLRQPGASGRVRAQQRAADAGLTEMILVTYLDSCGLRGVPVLTDGDWQESWLAAVIGVSVEMKGVLSVLDSAVALGVLAELLELFIKSDQAEVEDVDAISEMLESDPCPDLLERRDCLVPVSVALIVWSCLSQFVERGGVADCGTDYAGQPPDRRPGQQRAQAEAPPFRCQAYRVQDECSAAD